MKTHNIEVMERSYDLRGGAYGDQIVAAKYCGLQSAPYPVNGEWQHGWIVSERNIHPEFVIGSDGRSFDRRETCTFYVARQDQVDYLRSQGYKKVHAIGLPIIYVQKPRIERIPGSLLVMPAHSLPETKEEWNEDEYARYIKSITRRFSIVCLCVHKSCLEKGNWVGAFKDVDIRIIEGADEKDQNSYFRLAYLFSQFEFVTTNTFGSQVAYASYFGCKVSVAGPRLKWRRKDFEDLVLYRNSPELLDIWEEWQDRRVLDKAYSQFCCNPWEARLNVGWSALQLGVQHKRTPEELKNILGWNHTISTNVLLKKTKAFFNYGRHLIKRSSFIMMQTIHETQCKLFFRFEKSIFTHLTEMEKMLLYNISKQLDFNSVVVEIGSYLGASTCFIARGLNKGGKLYCIDTWGNHNMKYDDNDIDGEERDTYQEFMRNTEKYRDKAIPLRGWSHAMIENIKSTEDHIDFIFIDGDHKYEGVKKDWDLFSPLLKKGSFVAFHDTAWAAGVNKVIREEVQPIANLSYKLPNLSIYKINTFDKASLEYC
jgi:predicted O-methyltransferase YrrM